MLSCLTSGAQFMRFGSDPPDATPLPSPPRISMLLSGSQDIWSISVPDKEEEEKKVKLSKLLGNDITLKSDTIF